MSEVEVPRWRPSWPSDSRRKRDAAIALRSAQVAARRERDARVMEDVYALRDALRGYTDLSAQVALRAVVAEVIRLRDRISVIEVDND